MVCAILQSHVTVDVASGQPPERALSDVAFLHAEVERSTKSEWASAAPVQ